MPMSCDRVPVGFDCANADERISSLQAQHVRLFDELAVRDATIAELRSDLADAVEMIRELRKDHARYQRLCVLGCMPYQWHGYMGDVIRFATLDDFLDEDMAAYPSRGEHADLADRAAANKHGRTATEEAMARAENAEAEVERLRAYGDERDELYRHEMERRDQAEAALAAAVEVVRKARPIIDAETAPGWHREAGAFLAKHGGGR